MALMLPGVRSHLHLGLSQKPCWTTGLRVPPHQRQHPQLGPRALSLRVLFLLPVSLSSQSGFLPRPPSSHQEFPQPFYLFLLFSLASQPTPPRGSLPRSAPLLQPTQCWSWVCGSHLRLRPRVHLSPPPSRECLKNQGTASSSNPGSAPPPTLPPHSHTLCPPLQTPGPPGPSL